MVSECIGEKILLHKILNGLLHFPLSFGFKLSRETNQRISCLIIFSHSHLHDCSEVLTKPLILTDTLVLCRWSIQDLKEFPSFGINSIIIQVNGCFLHLKNNFVDLKHT